MAGRQGTHPSPQSKMLKFLVPMFPPLYNRDNSSFSKACGRLNGSTIQSSVGCVLAVSAVAQDLLSP